MKKLLLLSITLLSSAISSLAAIGTTIADYDAITDWAAIGSSRYTDIVVCYLDGFDPYAVTTYDVDTEESASHPGLYRLKNCNHNPEYYYGTIDESRDYWLVIDATDPDAVIIPLQKFGYNGDPYTDGYIESVLPGTLNSDTHEIRFPAGGLAYRSGETGQASQMNYPDTDGFEFTVGLPGAKDYACAFTSQQVCAIDSWAVFQFHIGADIDVVRAVIAKDIALDQLTQFAAASSITLNDGYNEFELTENGKYTLAYVAFDADGNQRATGYAFFYNYVDQPEQWRSIGQADFTESLMYSLFSGSGDTYGPNTYKVDVEENVNTQGYYRIVNPYANINNDAVLRYQYHNIANHNDYIFFHAENPSAVTVEEMPAGFDFGSGTLTLLPWGTGNMVNNVITMPAGSLGIWVRDYGSYSSQAPLVLALPEEYNAIDGIEADTNDADAEYFNLQGIRVDASALLPGIYLKRSGSTTTKVLIAE